MSDTKVSPPEADTVRTTDSPDPGRVDGLAATLLAPLRRTGSAVEQVVVFLVFLAIGLGAGLLLGLATGHSPGTILSTLIDGSIGSAISLQYTLTSAAPLILVAVGTVVCMKAGQFNIGQEGQVTLGAIGAGFVVFKVDGPASLIIPLAFVAGAALGAVWAALSALLKFWRGVDIVVSSLLLVFLAEQLLVGLISGNGPLHDTGGGTLGSSTASQSPSVPDSAMLPSVNILGVEVPGGFIIAVVVAVAVAWVLRSTVSGYRLRILGENARVARSIGVSAPKLGTTAVLVSGGLAGMAGVVVLIGQTYQLHPGISSAIGWDGLLIALAARMNMGVSVLLALIFGAMLAGGGLLGGAGVPNDIINVMTASIIVALLCPPLLVAALRRRRARRTPEVAAA